MNPNVRILKSTTEDCPHSLRQCLTLYFDSAPTIKQILYAAGAVKMAHKIKPDLSSRNLVVYSTPHDGQVKCQLVD